MRVMKGAIGNAARAAAAARDAVAMRRLQIEHLKTAVRLHSGDNHLRRQDVTAALVKLRRGWADFRTGVRLKLREIGAQAASRNRRCGSPRGTHSR